MRLSTVKKWWIIAVVFALALSLTSCSSRARQNLAFGINDECIGTMGEIDIYTIPVQGQLGYYKIVIIPATLTSPGDVATITAVNQSTLAYKTLSPEVVLNVDQEITAGFLSETELASFDLIAITSFVGGIDFLSANPAKDAICWTPKVGDGARR
jgi:hypothetical protein